MNNKEFIKNRSDIYRDSSSQAIISADTSAYTQRKKILRKREEEAVELNNLKDEVEKLKSIVSQLLEKDNE